MTPTPRPQVPKNPGKHSQVQTSGVPVAACNPTGENALDDAATIGTNQDGTAFSRCGCGELTCPSGTPQQATQALAAHRTGD